MRQYLYLFWALVIGGIVVLTAVYPHCESNSTRRYCNVYDTNGNLVFVSGNQHSSGMQYKF